MAFWQLTISLKLLRFPYTYAQRLYFQRDHMQESIATVTSKGRITVRLRCADNSGLKAGDKVCLAVKGDEVKLSPATSAGGYRSVPALAEPKTWAEIKRIVAEERAEVSGEAAEGAI